MKKIYLEGGKVCNAHGVRGVLKVESWCDSPKILAQQKRIFFASADGKYEEHKVLGASVSSDMVLLTVEGIESREAAIALKNTVFYLHRDDIPLKAGAMFIQDMIGLNVIDADNGKIYGKIKDVTDAVSGRLYTIETPNGDVLFPNVKEFIKEIDADKGMLIRPISGFFD